MYQAFPARLIFIFSFVVSRGTSIKLSLRRTLVRFYRYSATLRSINTKYKNST